MGKNWKMNTISKLLLLLLLFAPFRRRYGLPLRNTLANLSLFIRISCFVYGEVEL